MWLAWEGRLAGILSAATKNSTTAATEIPTDGHQKSPLTAT